MARATKVPTKVVKEWLSRQALWHIPHPKFGVPTPNAVYQADLLFMPRNQVGRKVYMSALTVVDVASRYKSRP